MTSYTFPHAATLLRTFCEEPPWFRIAELIRGKSTRNRQYFYGRENVLVHKLASHVNEMRVLHDIESITGFVESFTYGGSGGLPGESPKLDEQSRKERGVWKLPCCPLAQEYSRSRKITVPRTDTPSKPFYPIIQLCSKN